MCVCMLTHRKLVVKSFNFDDQSVLTSNQFILQLGHFSLIGWLCQVVAQNVYQKVKQDHTGAQEEGDK